ncbi:MAG TPA: hypothetical protein PKJ52_01245 [Rectinema sp.]|nr:hypothetical protein [Rectinema sp.]
MTIGTIYDRKSHEEKHSECKHEFFVVKDDGTEFAFYDNGAGSAKVVMYEFCFYTKESFPYIITCRGVDRVEGNLCDCWYRSEC